MEDRFLFGVWGERVERSRETDPGFDVNTKKAREELILSLYYTG